MTTITSAESAVTTTRIPKRVHKRKRVRKFPFSPATPHAAYTVVPPGEALTTVGVHPAILGFPLYVTGRKLPVSVGGELRPTAECEQFFGSDGHVLRRPHDGTTGEGLPSFADYRTLWQIAARLPRFESYAAVIRGTTPRQRRAMRTVEIPSVSCLLRELGIMGVSGPQCRRMRATLLRWKGTTVELPAAAAVGLPAKKLGKGLSIIEDVVFEESETGALKGIKVLFHEDFMHCLSSTSDAAVDLVALSKFCGPTAPRLWELLGTVFRKPVKGPGARRRKWQLPVSDLLKRLGAQRERHMTTTLSAAFDQIHAFDPSINYDLELVYDGDNEPMANFTCTRLPAAPQ